MTSVAEPAVRSEASTARPRATAPPGQEPELHRRRDGHSVLGFLRDLRRAHHPVRPALRSDARDWCGAVGSAPLRHGQTGRDVFSRVLAGSRDILLIAPLATLLATLVGTTLGLITGYFKGIADDTISRVVDALLAIPLILLAVTVVAALGSRSTWTVIIVIAAVFSPIIARTVRAAVLGEADLDYVEAARLRGEHAPYVMFSEVLPNVMPPILVEATIRLGYAIFAVATLSFIGFGLQPPSPDWAVQIADNYQDLAFEWWTVLFPALAIASLVVAVNLVSDSVQQVLER
jgi:peptide/nickel transport system permease protein